MSGKGKCAGGCGRQMMPNRHWACLTCKGRLPRDISRALFTAEWSGRPNAPQSAMSTPQARSLALEWWAANPIDAVELPPPAWTIDRRTS